MRAPIANVIYPALIIFLQLIATPQGIKGRHCCVRDPIANVIYPARRRKTIDRARDTSLRCAALRPASEGGSVPSQRLRDRVQAQPIKNTYHATRLQDLPVSASKRPFRAGEKQRCGY